MMTQTTLLAHIAAMLASSEENLATESLCFVLGESAAARTAFLDLLSRNLKRELPALVFKAQATDPDGTIPDVVGLDSQGKPIVYVEVKFWAGLTGSQPVGYLERLQREGGLGLVFLAPENRLATLWPELSRRCKDAGLQCEVRSGPVDYWLHPATLPPLGLTSWREVLGELLHACTVAGDASAAEDIRQLRGLCDRMEQEGFLPLRSEDLTGNLPRRIADYGNLVDDVTAALVDAGLASTKSLRAAAGKGYYRKYVTLKGNGAQIAFDAGWWAKFGATPLWLWLEGPDWKPSATIRAALQALLAAEPPEALVGADGAILVPLALPTGCERPEVLASLVAHVRAVCDLIPAGHGTDQPPPDEPV
jgi:hypothetical protein